MTSFATFIIEQARAGNLPSLFRTVAPTEGTVYCYKACQSQTPPDCLEQMGEGAIIRNFFEDFSEWTDEDKQDGRFDIPDCIHCEARAIAEDIEKAVADVRLFIKFDLPHLLECVLTGLVDADEMLTRTDPDFLDSDIAEAIGQAWVLSAVEKMMHTGRPDEDYPISIWAEEKRKEQDEKAKALLGAGNERDSDVARLLIFCASEMDFPARVMSLLLEASGIEDRELSHMVWLKGWMEFMSRKGSKVTFRRGKEPLDFVEDMPFPEESRQKAASDLARLETAIRKRVAELSR